MRCTRCNGTAREPAIPDLTDIDQRALAHGAGVSESLISRMLSDNPRQKRPNPTLHTMRGIQAFIEKKKGVKLPLDTIAALISD